MKGVIKWLILKIFNFDLRIGTVTHAEEFKEARVPAIKLEIDFGEPWNEAVKCSNYEEI